MTCGPRMWLTGGCLAVALWCLGSSGVAQDAEAAARTEEQVRRQAALLASDIDLMHLSNGEWINARRVQEPLMYYGEPTRNNSNGSVWSWGDDGRPEAIMELYQPSDRPQDWVAVISNLSGGRVRAARGGASWWLDNQSEVALRPVPDSTEVATQPRQRLRQMRKIAERFSAHQFWEPNNSRFELRLLSQPIARYSDEGKGLIDGSVFVLANGTNPEVILLLEGGRSEDGNLRWEYGLARLGHAEMHVSLDDGEVWTVPRVSVTPPDGAYWLDYRAVPESEFESLASRQGEQ